MATILIVEDEVALSDVVRSHLEKQGHSVQQVFDGRDAIACIDRSRPDLVILDWLLPGLDGLSVCRELRRKHLMPILMLTARGDVEDRVAGLQVGADDYLGKPFSIVELAARVTSILVARDLHPADREEAFDAGHITGAISFPESDVDARVAELPKDKLIVAYCQ